MAGHPSRGSTPNLTDACVKWSQIPMSALRAEPLLCKCTYTLSEEESVEHWMHFKVLCFNSCFYLLLYLCIYFSKKNIDEWVCDLLVVLSE